MLSKTVVKYIQSLGHKKLRDEHGVFIAEGPKVVTELLHSGLFCKIICGVKDWMYENEKLLNATSLESRMEVNEYDLEKMSLLKTPNKVVAVFYKKEDNEEVQLAGKITVMLDDIQDPGNFGTIIRIADWFGIENIICSIDCVDCYNPKVVQASMGSLARVNIMYTDLQNIIIKNKIGVYAATLTGTNILSLEKITEGIILIGNESKGIKEELLQLSAAHITIPKIGEAESLNAAVACGIILSHVVNDYLAG